MEKNKKHILIICLITLIVSGLFYIPYKTQNYNDSEYYKKYYHFYQSPEEKTIQIKPKGQSNFTTIELKYNIVFEEWIIRFPIIVVLFIVINKIGNSNSKQKEIDNSNIIQINKENMGYVVYEVARLRLDDIYNYLKNENEIKFLDAPLIVYTYIYNFFIIERVLLKKYSKSIVEDVMYYANKVFLNYLSSSFDENEVSLIKKDVQHAYELLNKIFLKEYSIAFDNPLRDSSKLFLRLITNDERSALDEVNVVNLTIEISSWVSLSEFLIKKYNII